MPEGGLRAFIEDVSGDEYLAVEENLGDGFVRLKTAEAERRQAKHDIRSVEDIVIEMLRNARDAHARHVYVATTREERTRRLAILDDGDGIPGHLHEAVFEPRVTSKLESMVMDRWGVHGRGMALYSIRENASAARVVASGAGLGSSFEVVVDLDALPERKDQSTYPRLERGEDGETVVASGPHNMVRTATEFALASRERTTVYFGTPTDIVARLVEEGRRALTDDELLFCDDVALLPVCSRPAAAGDAAELMEVCGSIGLPISERTAHRVLAGQIPPCPPLLSRVQPDRGHRERRRPDITRDSRGLKIGDEDLRTFERALTAAFQSIAPSYFIRLGGPPKVHVGRDCINVKFNIEKDL